MHRHANQIATARTRAVVLFLWALAVPVGLGAGWGWRAVVYLVASVVALAAAWHLSESTDT